MFSCATAAAQTLQKVIVEEDNILLLSARLNSKGLNNVVDAYQYNDKLLVAIEPLFDSLNLRYRINDNNIVIWVTETETLIQLKNEPHTEANGMWFSDGFYTFVDTDTLSMMFGVKVAYNPYRLRLDIETDKYLFPSQIIEQQNTQRTLEKFGGDNKNKVIKTPTITIKDQYRLVTLPHGQLSSSINLANDKDKNNTTLQLVSDLLYHSANISLSQNNDEVSASLQFSRYKEHPDDLILGLFDRYSFGDVGSKSNSLTNSSRGGVGINTSRSPIQYRQRNQSVSFREFAPAGWDVELFLNNRFVLLTTVPDDGVLILEDVETEYGGNNFLIKLYGPFGEKRTISRSYDLTKNALAKGQVAYDLFALDGNNRLINNEGNTGYKFTDIGGSFDVGLSDSWQLGMSYSNAKTLRNDQDDLHLFTLKNALSFPGLLFENEVAFDQNGGYAQLTSVLGNVFKTGRYRATFESANKFNSARVNTSNGGFQNFKASFSDNYNFINYGFNLEGLSQNNTESWRLSNNVSGSIGGLFLNHNINYFLNENIGISGEISKSSRFSGALGLAGVLLDSLRISANVNYDPDAESLILDSSSIGLQWTIKDIFELDHYINLNFQPLENSDRLWRLSHNVAWETEQYRISFASNYNANNNWFFNAGLQFFFGYDHHNNRGLMSSEISGNSATLDIHTYLDRQFNGMPDRLDHDLDQVSFVGGQGWEELTTGVDGRIVLPGASPNGAFKFGAKWRTGSQTIINDYVVYTHPGAYVDVNMPFYLSTDISGFVAREGGNEQGLLANADMQLIAADDNVVLVTKSDFDGYYEFSNLKPGRYTIKITQDYLREKGYTSTIVGYKFSTPEYGGFIEIDTIVLNRSAKEGEWKNEDIIEFELNENNSEPVIWDEDQKKLRDYFNLPSNATPIVIHSLSGDDIDEYPATITKNRLPPKISNVENGSLIQLPSIKMNQKSQLPPSVLDQEPSLGINQKGELSPVIIGRMPSIENAQGNEVPVTIEGSEVNPSLGQYSIQLAAYRNLSDAETFLQTLPQSIQARIIPAPLNDSESLNKIVYGQFSSAQEANQSASQNLPDSQAYFVTITPNFFASNIISPDNNDELPWVLQLYASQFPETLIDQVKPFKSLGNLYFGQKQVQTTTGETKNMYCIISRGFATKQAALDALNATAISAWVTTAASFNNVSAISGR